jgi:hypothetical protein
MSPHGAMNIRMDAKKPSKFHLQVDLKVQLENGDSFIYAHTIGAAPGPGQLR